MAFVIEDVTVDDAGDPLGDCQVYAFKYAVGTNDFSFVVAGTSDGSGNYSLTVPDDDPVYMVVGYKNGVPLAGVTRRDVTPAFVADLATFDSDLITFDSDERTMDEAA